MAKPKVMYWISEDWYFWSHRLGLARAARDAGWDVAIATRVHEHGDRIRAEGFSLTHIDMARRVAAPWRDAENIAQIFAAYRRERPDVVHQVGMKQMLYGSAVTRILGVPGLVNAFAGLGTMFLAKGPAAAAVKYTSVAGFRAVMGHPNLRVIFQNEDDRGEIVGLGIVPVEKTVIIRGSGVNTDVFHPTPLPDGTPLFVLPARILWDKGVGEMVEAARKLKSRGVNARIALVGNHDPDNPSHVDKAQIEAWVNEGVVEWWGRRDDMPQVFAQSRAVVLPSYREGLPKALLEAAACGRAVVSTDTPGCREVARDGQNGILVPVRDSDKLADAMELLANDKDLARRYGETGRKIIVEELSEQYVINATLAVYKELLANAKKRHY